MEEQQNRRILIVDDNRAIHDDYRKILSGDSAGEKQAVELAVFEAELFGGDVAPARGATYDVVSAYQGEEAYAKVVALAARGEHFALAFVDMHMPPGWDGVQTIAKIWECDPEIQVVICSAYSEYSWEQILSVFGPTDRLLILKKPFDTAEVCQLACALSEKWHLARRAHLKLNQLKSMVEEQTHELRIANERLEHELAERSQLTASLAESEARYALAAAGTNEGLWDWDLSAGTIYYSARWKELLGYEADELSTDPNEWFGRVHPDDLEPLQGAVSEHLHGSTPHLEHEYRIRHKDRQYRWMLCRGLAIRGSDGRALRAAGSQNDITNRRMAEEQLRHDAFHDALTGLPNRALLSDRLRQCLLRARRDPSKCFALLFIDLDHFKLINDTLGHAAGDDLLVSVARRVVSCLRAGDSVAYCPQNEVARLGGDEFVVLLEGMRHESDAIRVTKRLQTAFAGPIELSGKEVFVSMSVGIALGRPDYESAEALLRDADTALYQAKANGRGCYAVFDAEMHASVMSRWWIENELRSAIDRGELRLVYQPVRALGSGELCEFEALLRWQHSERGNIPPSDFIPVAEESGLIGAIGKWVLEAGVSQLREWEALFADLPKFALAINVSAKQLAHPEFVEELTEILRSRAVPGSRVRLEVTESALMSKAVATSALARMRELELKFHLDDFGTGHSSLSYLHRIRVDALKIDRSFVKEMETDPVSVSIVESIILLAHALGAEVIAEGVETEEQLARLRALRCDMAQGYLFSKPVEVAEATAMLQRARLTRTSSRPSSPSNAHDSARGAG